MVSLFILLIVLETSFTSDIIVNDRIEKEVGVEL